MGSKRTKKTKQEQEILPEKSIIKTSNDETMEPGIDQPIDNGVIPNVLKAPKKRKKKSEDEIPKKVKKTAHSEGDEKKVKVKKKKVKLDENQENKQSLNGANESVIVPKQKNDTPEKKKQAIMWPDEDIVELINRMESNIPETDALAYKSRIEKLSWENVAFKGYSSEDCKKTWMMVQKRIRRFRLLKEMLNDAKEWINTPKTTINRLPRPKKHPDMPRRPLSSYLLFYLKKKDEIISENPGLDGSDITKIVGQIYKNLPPEKREKYEKLAASNREEYLEKLKIFFEKHPEIVPPQRLNLNHKIEKEKQPLKVEKPPEKVPTKVEKEKAPKTEKVPKVEKALKPVKPKGRPGRPPKTDHGERPPKKCQTPFGLFYAAEMKNMEPGTEKSAFKEKCKLMYRQMADKKKVHWINLAEQDLIRYQEEVKAYKAKYPEFKIHKVRSILTKREQASKERASGKPLKPPNSAYALYSRLMLQSAEIKSVHPKDRMNYIANKWKACSEVEQNSYRDQVTNLMEQYKQDYQSYLDSLPEEERRKILLLQTKKKKGKSGRVSGRMKKARKRKMVKRVQPVKTKFSEPEQPPISAARYFATLYKGDGDPVQAWKALSAEEKRKYEDELVKKKQAYIVEFEKFLKSLSKEELEAFSKSRQQQTPSDEEDSSDCSSASEGEGEEEDGEEANDENGDELPNGDDPQDSDTD